MQVILKKDIPQIGRIGELVKVRDGYARNFLIPRQLAAPANPQNIRQLEHQKRVVEFQKKKIQKESEKLATDFNGIEITLERRVNEGGKLFGSLSNTEIAAELVKKNLKVDRRDIEIETIRSEGTYALKVRLPGDVYASLTLNVKGIQEKADKKAVKGKAKGGKKAKAVDAEENSAVAEEEVDQSTTSE